MYERRFRRDEGRSAIFECARRAKRRRTEDDAHSRTSRHAGVRAVRGGALTSGDHFVDGNALRSTGGPADRLACNRKRASYRQHADEHFDRE